MFDLIRFQCSVLYVIYDLVNFVCHWYWLELFLMHFHIMRINFVPYFGMNTALVNE